MYLKYTNSAFLLARHRLASRRLLILHEQKPMLCFDRRRRMTSLTEQSKIVDASKYRVVFITISPNEAKNLASALVESEHVACVNIVPGVNSVYKWQGKIEEDQESLLIAKTSTDALDAVQKLINEKHPYDTPELLAMKVDEGASEYVKWLGQVIKN